MSVDRYHPCHFRVVYMRHLGLLQYVYIVPPTISEHIISNLDIWGLEGWVKKIVGGITSCLDLFYMPVNLYTKKTQSTMNSKSHLPLSCKSLQ